MAALVRFGAARAWRLFASNSVRSSLIYQRNSSASYKEHLWRAWQPIISSSRFLSNESSPNEEVTNGEKVDNQIEGDTSVASTGVRRGSDYQDSRMSSDPKQGGDFKYKRQVKQLGTLLMKAQLIRTFEEILEREGKITSLQAYQVLRNCGTELQYEKPADRVELAHYFWDQLMKMGVKQDVMLYNALLSVYLQNNHNFNPMDILEKMEQSNIDPNRTTLLLLIQGYAQRGDIAGVFKVLEFMKTGGIPVTEQVFAALITAYGVNGDPESARGVFDLMRTNGLEPELDSYTALLAIYSEAGDMESIMKTVDEMQEKHVYPNRKVFVTVLDSLSKRGHHELIRQILQTPIVKSLLEGDLNDLMMAAATRGEMSSAFIFLGHMIETGSSRKMNLHPAYALLRQVIISGQPIDAILVTLSELEKLATFKNVYEDALDISFRKRDPEITQAIIQEMLQKELRVRVHYFYPLLAMYAQNQDARAAQEVVNIIGSNGFAMTGTIFRFLMQSYGNPDAKDVESFMNLSQDAPVSKYLLTVMAQLMMAAGQLDKLQKAVEYAKNENVNMRCISDAFGNYLLKRNFDPRNAVEIVKLLDSLEVTDGLSTAIHLSCHKCPKGKITNIVEFVTLLLKEGFHRHLDSRALSFVMASLADNAMPTEFYDFVRMMKEQKVDLDIHQYRQMLRMLAFDGKAEAAQFCFDKAAKLEEPSALLYSYLMQAYAHCPEGGIHAHMPKDRNMRRIIQLYDLMTAKEFKPTVRAIGGACIAHLHMGDVEKAEEVRRMHGFGQPRVKVLFQFMRNYSRSGDVAKTLEFFEELKKEMKDLDLPLLLYNNLLHVYAFHGDIESQWKVFEKIKENNLEPNQYSYSNIVRTYLLKDDIDTALKTFQDAKEEGKFIADGTCLLLLNSMARTGRLEHFENVLEDIMTNRIASGYSMKWPALLRGLMFCCLHAGKKDLAFKIQLEHEVRVEVHAFVTLSESSAKRGEVQAVLNAIEFFKENDINPAALYLPLIKAHDARKDPDAIKAVYEQLVSEGVELGPLFVQQCNKILLKYADTTFSEADPPPQAQTEQVQDELSSDDEENPMEDIREDFEEEEKSE